MRAFLLIHGFDRLAEMRGDGVAPQFAIGGEQAAFDRQRLRLDVERANLAVMRQRRIQPRDFRFRLVAAARRRSPAPRDSCAHGRTAPPAARRESACANFSSSGSGAMLWPELRISRFFSRPMMRQFPAGRLLALIAGVEPAVCQRLAVSSGRFQ